MKKIINSVSEGIERLNFAGGEVVLFCNKKGGEERLNQDSLALIPVGDRRGVIVVSDGLGGHRGGDEASRIAIETMCSMMTTAIAKKDTNLRERILEGIELANEAIRALGIGAGATISVAEISGHQVRFYNVGDSTGFLIGGKGLIKYQNVAQSPVGHGLRAGILDEELALNHEESNVVLNALGDEYIRVEVTSFLSLASRDIVLVASDGLTDNIKIEELQEIITKGALNERLDRIVALVEKNMAETEFGHPDDLSLVLFNSNLA